MFPNPNEISNQKAFYFKRSIKIEQTYKEPPDFRVIPFASDKHLFRRGCDQCHIKHVIMLH